ncbi:TPA: NAD(P)-dependent oxidoreductase [Kluyvera ascorbata]|nr:NAD(P)-dependent oxidoreductase [Kluyvera ascorbata]
MTTITFIGYGEAGGILADALAKKNPVTVWDCKFNGPERDAMIMKARQGGVRAAISLADALTGAELIFSTVTAGSALDVASQAALLMTDKQYFLDLNSVAPQTKRQAAERFKSGTYVDVAVMAPVPPAALRTPLLIGGPQAQAITELLTVLGCHARYGGNDIGSVSAIKMCRSVMIKGLEALTAECLFAAHQYGVEEAVLASLHASFPSLGWNDAFPGYLISRVAEHGIRRSEEMEEVVKTLRDAAGESVMSQATAIAQRHLPERMAALGITYAQLEPFNWKALTALLKEHI